MKVTIIGAGRNRNGIGEYIAKYFHNNGVKVVAVLGTTEATTRKASFALKQYGIDSVPYTDFYKMVEAERPDTVVIASPSRTHYGYLIKCVDSGLSIFCEKPFLWDETGNIRKTIEGVFTKANEKKLTIAMNSQLPFSIGHYERICGKINTDEINKFFIGLSPSVLGKEMIPESVPHTLSILYFIFKEGEIRNLAFESAEEKKIIIGFSYVSQANKCNVSIKLTTQEKQPPDFSFGFNDKIATRTIDSGNNNYDLYFNYKNKKLKITDPLESSVKDFIVAFERKTEPLIGYAHILNNMSLLREIYDGYKKVVKTRNGKTKEPRT